jgi:hypothetical protein
MGVAYSLSQHGRRSILSGTALAVRRQPRRAPGSFASKPLRTRARNFDRRTTCAGATHVPEVIAEAVVFAEPSAIGSPVPALQRVQLSRRRRQRCIGRWFVVAMGQYAHSADGLTRSSAPVVRASAKRAGHRSHISTPTPPMSSSSRRRHSMTRAGFRRLGRSGIRRRFRGLHRIQCLRTIATKVRVGPIRSPELIDGCS